MKFNPYIFIAYGILIVFSGLAFLAVFISNTGKFFSFMRKYNRKIKKNKKYEPLSRRILDRAENLFLINREKGEPFFLPDLINSGLKAGLENPWEIVDLLIRQGLLKADGKGMFLWNKNSFYYKKIAKADLKK